MGEKPVSSRAQTLPSSGELFFWGRKGEEIVKRKKTILDIRRMKHDGEKISMLTCYDYPTARILDESGVDVLLVGDSAGVVFSGCDTTLPVTLDEMIYHSKAVARAKPKALVVADLPFLSYQIDLREARLSAGRLIKEGGAEAVKLEGGENSADSIRAVVAMDIPVMAHIGLTPQSIHRMGGYKVQGKSETAGEKLLRDALAVQEAGAFAVVLEGIPYRLARRITTELTIPTIGIGAGPYCDGQVLVIHDILGLCEKYSPKFVKRYADVKSIVSEAASRFSAEVKAGEFPTEEHSFS
jgi:3-methyl-2-oxobutanoate hydroxymethyltransferase